MTEPTPEPDLHPRVYWTVALVAVLILGLLAWFTATFHIPLAPR